jgi:hypothetical protein
MVFPINYTDTLDYEENEIATLLELSVMPIAKAKQYTYFNFEGLSANGCGTTY